MTVANGTSLPGPPERRPGMRPLRRSRSIGQSGRKMYMTRRIDDLHVPAARHSSANAQQLDAPARPAEAGAKEPC